MKEWWEKTDVTPGDVMYMALQHGHVTMEQFMKWYKTNKSWEDVKNTINDEKKF